MNLVVVASGGMSMCITMCMIPAVGGAVGRLNAATFEGGGRVSVEHLPPRPGGLPPGLMLGWFALPLP